MCGRFTLFSDDSDLVSLFDIDVLEGEHGEAFNEAPSEWIRAVVDAGPRILTLQKWGLLPHWAKKGFRPLINARSETVTEKPSFRSAALRRRCLLPTNGYYEWMVEESGRKQPYFLSAAGPEGQAEPYRESPVLAMAGIYEWSQTDGLVTCAIITRTALDSVGHIHDRMPLFVPPEFQADWLNPELQNKADVQDLIGGMPQRLLAAQKVSTAVGNVRVEDPEEIFGGSTTLF